MANILLCSDIFGATPHFLGMAEHFNALGMETVALSPYSVLAESEGSNHVQSIYFTDEQEAYGYFIKRVGHNNYQATCHQQLERLISTLPPTKQLFIFAFSAGASAIWVALSQLSAQPELKDKLQRVHFIGCYPSQIRYHTQLSYYLCHTYLIFPSQEQHFDLAQTQEALVAFSNTKGLSLKVYKTPWLHGFLNPYSVNYNQQASESLIAAFKNLTRLDEVNTHYINRILGQKVLGL